MAGAEIPFKRLIAPEATRLPDMMFLTLIGTQ